LQKAEQNIEKQVNILLDRIRGYLHEDGGDVEFVSYEPGTGILNVRLTGNCRDCPFSIMTLRGGIERYLKFEMPEITRIEQVK